MYVADVGNNVVDKFTAEGEYVSQLQGTCASPGTCSGSEIAFTSPLRGVAVDASGNLWVYDNAGNVDQFSATGAFVKSFNTGRGAEPGLALDSRGAVYAINGEPTVSKYEGGVEVTEFATTQGAKGVAVDPPTATC